jgi:phosphoglycerate kinase
MLEKPMKFIKDIDVTSKKVFVRVDYNVPMDENLNITDDNRIIATLDLILYLLEQDAKIILASHMGRPNGKRDPKFSLAPVCKRLSQLLNKQVLFADDCIGDEVEKRVSQLTGGQILMLENLRFHKEEKDNNDGFSQKLANLCDVYVNNAFAVSHRDQASVTGIPKFANESAAGFLLEKEVQSYYDSVENPERPLVAVIGGAKVSGKLAALENMLKFVDTLIIGGAMANTFLKSQGIDTQASVIEDDLLQTAANIVQKAKEKGIDLAAVKDAGTIVWNGPMGVFEMEKFMSGTQILADAIAASDAFSIVGGGDTGLAAKKCNVADKVSYISTGGGAFLHLMEGKKLPGVVALEKRNRADKRGIQ